MFSERPAFLFLNGCRGIGTSEVIHKIAGRNIYFSTPELVNNLTQSSGFPVFPIVDHFFGRFLCFVPAPFRC
jgi:hypothetical protein